MKTAWGLWRDHPRKMQDYIEDRYVALARASDLSALQTRLEEDMKSYLARKDLEHIL